jgi:hypothetical protein
MGFGRRGGRTRELSRCAPSLGLGILLEWIGIKLERGGGAYWIGKGGSWLDGVCGVVGVSDCFFLSRLWCVAVVVATVWLVLVWFGGLVSIPRGVGVVFLFS